MHGRKVPKKSHGFRRKSPGLSRTFPIFSINRWATADVSPRAASKMTWKIILASASRHLKASINVGMSKNGRIDPHLISIYWFYGGKYGKMMISHWIWGVFPKMFEQSHDVQSISKPTGTAATKLHRCSSYTDLRSAHISGWSKMICDTKSRSKIWSDLQVNMWEEYAKRNGKCLGCQLLSMNRPLGHILNSS